MRTLFAIDPRSLAAFRIAIGIVLLVDLGIRATDLSVMYTDEGMFSRETICRYYSVWNWSFHFGGGSSWYQAVLFGSSALFTLSLLIGFETRLSSVAAWLLLVSMHNRVPLVLSGADNLARVLLFWGLFLPLGRVWSVDAWRARQRGRPPGGDPVLSVASAAILLQMAFMYLFSAVFKSNPDWIDGKAMAAIVQNSFYGKPWAVGLVEFPGVLAAITVGVLVVEWLGPFLLFSPLRSGTVRLWVVGLLLCMHLGIELLLNVGLFSFVSISGLILFLPASFWDRLLRRSVSVNEESERPNATAEMSRETQPTLVSMAARGTCALALAYVLFANVNSLPARFLPWTPAPKMEFLTVSCGLGQKWDMFATTPVQDGWYVARATLADGTRVDLLREGEPAVWAKPDDPAGVYPNHRWLKLFREMSYGDAKGYQLFCEPVAEYLCRAWNESHSSGKRVSLFALVFCREDTDEYGLDPTPPILRETLVHLDFTGRSETP